MKIKVVTLICCLVLLLNVGNAVSQEPKTQKANEELQSTIDTLRTQVQDLITQQAAQEEKLEAISNSWMKDLTIGGNLKIYMFDQSFGRLNGVHSHNHISAGLSQFYLLISKKLSSWLSITVKPRINVTASATPKLGDKTITRGSATYDINLLQAFMWARLPKDVEVKVGKVSVMFFEEYAEETWWSEQYHLNNPLHYIQSWYDNGLEVHKHFDLGNVGLPIYIYAVNGDGGEVDSNNAKTGLLHIAPEFFNGRFKLMGSYGRGKWNNDNYTTRYVTGFEWKYRKYTLEGNYLRRKDDGRQWSRGGNTDAETRLGYITKLLYQFTPRWRAGVNYQHARLFYTGAKDYRDIINATSLNLNYFITEDSTIVLQNYRETGRRSDDSASLTNNRITLGWRTTF